MLRWSSIAAACLALAPLSACVVHTHPATTVVVPPGQAKKIVHVHGVDCGHCWTGDEWIVLAPAHVHGPGCGHVLVSGAWHVVRVKVK